ncbi:MAG TPA: nitrate/sulfonate/bicarbonate ABC transporter ATP-binding protein [Verrucomicrobiae bacterium]|nr:nitrate/sulfonate/bicarbonate ABC transporter ATP-binding protein [Verrucomicrobiae bacterium]
MALEKDIICETRNVTKTFRLPGGKELKVLDNISLDVRRNDITCILGPSGCGKSTLVRILTGLVEPSSGEVLVHGQRLRGLSAAVSMVFQSFALYPWLTVAENVAMGLNGRGIDRKKSAELVARAVDRVGLEGFEEAYPKELSGGMKQRVGIARALVAQPELLCMDEPFSGLDVLTAENMRVELVNLWQDAKTDPNSVVVVTHNINEAVFLATRIVVMSAKPGQIRKILDNPLPYPRDYRDPAFIAMSDRIHDILTTALIPDEPIMPPAIPAAPSAIVATKLVRIVPLPNVNVGEMIGLLERVDNAGGTADIFDLSVEIGKEFGKILELVKAAELLDFVDTPKHLVTLTPLGRQLLAAKVNDRKRLMNQQLRELQLIRRIIEMLQTQEGKAIDEDLVLEELAVWLPTEKPQVMFKGIVRWGRYAELLGYNADERKLYLDLESTSAPSQQPLALDQPKTG